MYDLQSRAGAVQISQFDFAQVLHIEFFLRGKPRLKFPRKEFCINQENTQKLSKKLIPDSIMNIFNTNLDRVDESRESARGANSKLIESVLAISEAQKKFYANQKSLLSHRNEIATMRDSNKGLRIALMKALIERDELIIKRSALKAMNERIMNHNDNLNRETDDLLRGDEVASVCERFALTDQIKLLKEIQDARCKLINYGFPLSFFA